MKSFSKLMVSLAQGKASCSIGAMGVPKFVKQGLGIKAQERGFG